MFRSPKPGDWAAEDDSTLALPTPAPGSPSMVQASSPTPPSRQDAQRTSGERFHGDRTNRGGRVERDREYQSGRFDRETDNRRRSDGRDRETRRFDRDREADRDDRRFDRDRGADRDERRFDRDREVDRDERRFDRERGADRDERRFERDTRRPMPNKWGHNADRRGARDLPLEEGFVVHIKENFGFVRSMEREGDLFFHMSEAPVDIQLQDEVEFRVKYNQRSDKEMACHLVVLPKGTIQMEEVTDQILDGVVTKSLPRGGHGGRGSFQDERYGYREEYGLIEVKKEEKSEETVEERTEQDKVENNSQFRRDVIRFTVNSMANNDVETREDEKQDSDRCRTKLFPQFGDEVRFRVAKHRKTGVKRAIDLSITLSAREKLEKEIEAKLATMTRENGVVNRVKNGGGFIKCCDRPIDIYFPFHEVLESKQSDGQEVESGDTSQRFRAGKGALIREGDEVSFYVYEDQENESVRSRSRLTALRVQKLPPGSVSFEELIRANVEGFVSKLPKEPRHGPEVIGCVYFEPSAVDDEGDQVGENELCGSVEKPLKQQEGKDEESKRHKLAFRLCDTEDANYVPFVDDKVAFDEVLDKRTGNMKAVKVRVIQFNPKNRETGTINALKDDFGFIKCTDRSGDAYFRFSDVMGPNRSFSNGTEVAFDVAVDSKSDHIRATRIQVLPRGTIKREDVVGEGLEGEIVAVPILRRGLHSSRGGRGDKLNHLPKFVCGKITFSTPLKQHLIDFLPELKRKVDTAFLSSEDSEKDENTLKESEEQAELRIVFSSSLSKFERAALHEYSEWLGLNHTSSGEGLHRQLAISASSKIPTKTVMEKLATAAPELTVEFKDEDLDDVRYNPHVGDRVKFDLVIIKRTKQFQCKSISCLEAAASIPNSKAENIESSMNKGEGYIVFVKPEGFGFIRPALQMASVSFEENLYFHIRDITTGESLQELKEGTEVQYTVLSDEKKKKKRAVGIHVVPAGTIQKVVPKSMKGVVYKASLLQRMKSGSKSRLAEPNKASTLGSIRLSRCGTSIEDEEDVSDAEADGESEDEAEMEERRQDGAVHESNDETKKLDKKKVGKERRGTPYYVYNLRDLVDPSVVLREGDEVEFVPQITPKHVRASQIRLVASHAKQGVVTRITQNRSNRGGIIRLDGDEPALEAKFTDRRVLRGDTLSVGDRVEFAYKPPPVTSMKNAPLMDDKEKKPDEMNSEKPTNGGFGQALSILHLSSPSSSTTLQRREARKVNSTLKEAMRQVGANAMVASRMARGPDGTRGFVEWGMLETGKTTETASENVTVNSSSTAVSSTGATDEKKT